MRPSSRRHVARPRWLVPCDSMPSRLLVARVGRWLGHADRWPGRMVLGRVSTSRPVARSPHSTSVDVVARRGRRGRPGRRGRSRGRRPSGRGRGGPGAPASRRTPRGPALRRPRRRGAPGRRPRARGRGGRPATARRRRRRSRRAPAARRAARRPSPRPSRRRPRRATVGSPSSSASPRSASAPSTTVIRAQPPSRRSSTPRCSQEPAVVGDQRLRHAHPATGAGGEQQSFHAGQPVRRRAGSADRDQRRCPTSTTTAPTSRRAGRGSLQHQPAEEGADDDARLASRRRPARPGASCIARRTRM